MLSSKTKRELKIDQRQILIDSIEIGIPSPQQILTWGERILPNGKRVGLIKNSKTVNYKRFTPFRDGLFCERIFGPVTSFVCACGKKQSHSKVTFCEKCEVEYIDSRSRRYRLGYISLLSPVTHIWYLKGRPGYLSLFLGKRKKTVVALAYCNAYLISHGLSKKNTSISSGYQDQKAIIGANGQSTKNYSGTSSSLWPYMRSNRNTDSFLQSKRRSLPFFRKDYKAPCKTKSKVSTVYGNTFGVVLDKKSLVRSTKPGTDSRFCDTKQPYSRLMPNRRFHSYKSSLGLKIFDLCTKYSGFSVSSRQGFFIKEGQRKQKKKIKKKQYLFCEAAAYAPYFYARQQTLPFLPSLVCHFYLRDALLNFSHSLAIPEDFPLMDYCDTKKWEPLRDVHRFMAHRTVEAFKDDLSYGVIRSRKAFRAPRFLGEGLNVHFDSFPRAYYPKPEPKVRVSHRCSYKKSCGRALTNKASYKSFYKYKLKRALTNLRFKKPGFLEPRFVSRTNQRFITPSYKSTICTKGRSNLRVVQIEYTGYKAKLCTAKALKSQIFLFSQWNPKLRKQGEALYVTPPLRLQSEDLYAKLPATLHTKLRKKGEALYVTPPLRLQSRALFALARIFAPQKKKVGEPSGHTEQNLAKLPATLHTKRSFVTPPVKESGKLCFLKRKLFYSACPQGSLKAELANKYKYKSSICKLGTNVPGFLNPCFRNKPFTGGEEHVQHARALICLNTQSKSEGTTNFSNSERKITVSEDPNRGALSGLELIAIREILSYTGGGALQQLLQQLNAHDLSKFLFAEAQILRVLYETKSAIEITKGNRNQVSFGENKASQSYGAKSVALPLHNETSSSTNRWKSLHKQSFALGFFLRNSTFFKLSKTEELALLFSRSVRLKRSQKQKSFYENKDKSKIGHKTNFTPFALQRAKAKLLAKSCEHLFFISTFCKTRLEAPLPKLCFAKKAFFLYFQGAKKPVSSGLAGSTLLTNLGSKKPGFFNRKFFCEQGFKKPGTLVPRERYPHVKPGTLVPSLQISDLVANKAYKYKSKIAITKSATALKSQIFVEAELSTFAKRCGYKTELCLQSFPQIKDLLKNVKAITKQSSCMSPNKSTICTPCSRSLVRPYKRPPFRTNFCKKLCTCKPWAITFGEKTFVRPVRTCLGSLKNLKGTSVLPDSLFAVKGPGDLQKKQIVRISRRIYKVARRLKIANLLTRNQRKPEWMILSHLPVLPPDLRPILQMSEKVIVASDLNIMYQRVIYRNNRHLRVRFIDFHLVTAIQRLVQDAVDRLIENGKGGTKPYYTQAGRPLKSLSDILKGKKGRFRLNLLGKRVDFSGRSVIVVSPLCQIHECGLPKEIALELYHYFLLRTLIVKRYCASIVTAKKMIKSKSSRMWDILRILMYHHPVLLNRAPTLHRLGIQAFQPKLVLGNAIALHPLVCSGFNADFDGDQMGVHLPLSFAARAESLDLLWSRNNLLSPATGQPMLVPSQDMVLGFYYMTARALVRETPQTKQLQIEDLYKPITLGDGHVRHVTARKVLRNDYKFVQSFALFSKICMSPNKDLYEPYGHVRKGLSGALLTKTDPRLKKGEALYETSLGQRFEGDKTSTSTKSLTNRREPFNLGEGHVRSFVTPVTAIKEGQNRFLNVKDITRSFETGNIKLHQPVWLYWRGKIENDEGSQKPLELRVHCFGIQGSVYEKYIWKGVFTKAQAKINLIKKDKNSEQTLALQERSAPQFVLTHQPFRFYLKVEACFVRTTAGRVVMNNLLKTKKDSY